MINFFYRLKKKEIKIIVKQIIEIVMIKDLISDQPKINLLLMQEIKPKLRKEL